MEAYGHWGLVAINILFILIFSTSFFRPATKTDWRTLGAFSAFIVALFTEMYGFPFTIYILSGWLTRLNPEIDWFSHDASHLLQSLTGWTGNAHFSPLHWVSNTLIVLGLICLARSWKVLLHAQKENVLADSGPYAHIRHPQYLAFMMILTGFLLQWPTIPTIIMFPILIFMYVRLARREERQALGQFGDAYRRYAEATPRFFPFAMKPIESDL